VPSHYGKLPVRPDIYSHARLFASNLYTKHRSNRQLHNGVNLRGSRRPASSSPSDVSKGDSHAILVTDDCSTEQNQNDSPLLRLPAELRSKIYAYVSDHTTAEACFFGKQNQFKIKFKHYNFGLLLACQQLLYEAKPYINSHQHMTWHGSVLSLEEPSWFDNMEDTQIKSIVFSAYKMQHGLHNYDLGFLRRVIPMWPSLRYIEMQRDVIWVCQEDVLEILRRRMPKKDLIVCISLEEGRAVWTFDCRDRQLTISGQPLRQQGLRADHSSFV
jgi:hypothetical protein